MKQENIERRINNFFNNIFDESSEQERSKLISFCKKRFNEIKKHCPKLCDSNIISIAIEETLREFHLWK